MVNHEINELVASVKALESQRATLGDRVVDAALAPLEEKLSALEEEQPANRQRRLVTVMFVDIVNSTLLSQGLEPEEVLEIMGGALKRLSTPINNFGGKITQVMGDGFVAVFGLAKIQENDARQAVRAGLSVLADSKACAEDLNKRYQISGFNVRVGINTGRVVIGRFTEIESTVMGLAVSLAARMEQLAQPGSLLISQYTYRHIRGAFEVEGLKPIEAKGFPEPISVYRVLSARPRTFQTITRGVDGKETSFIGREVELGQLQALLNHAFQNQEAQLVTVIGEAGVGKSRLLYEFDRWIAASFTQVTAFKARSSPQMLSVPFSLLREMVTYHLGLKTTDPIDRYHQKFIESIKSTFDEDGEMKAHFVGTLLGYDFSNSPYLQGLINDPEQISKRAMLYLIQYFLAVMSGRNTVIMLDDVNWADPPSIDFINQLFNECRQFPLFVVCLARPTLIERFPDWGERFQGNNQVNVGLFPLTKSTRIHLNPLSMQESHSLLDEIIQNIDILPENLYYKILNITEGNPYYIEEFVQSLLDTKIIYKNQLNEEWEVDSRQLDTLELPATLTALLEARMDSLNVSQRVLIQQASVIGNTFWLSALQSIRDDKPVDDTDIAILKERGFIYPQESSRFNETKEYQFNHMLLRDVAYQTLYKTDRMTMHYHTATWLIDMMKANNREAEFAPIIAEHLEAAGEKILAADWYTHSGKTALNQGATAQALNFFEKSLAFLPADEELLISATDLQRRWHALADHDRASGILGFTDKRIEDDIALVNLAKKIGDAHLIAEAYIRMGFYLGNQSQYSQELEAYKLGLEAAKEAGDKQMEARLLGLKVMSEIRIGDFETAAQTAKETLACVEFVTNDIDLSYTLANVYNYYIETGDVALGAQLLGKQVEIIHHTGDLYGEASGLLNLGYAYILLGSFENGIAMLQKCIEIAQSIGHRRICAYGALNLALAHFRNDDPSATITTIEKCLPEFKTLNDSYAFAICLTYKALANEKIEQLDTALQYYMEASGLLNQAATPGARFDAEAGIARCFLARNDPNSAANYAKNVWDYLQQRAGAGMELPIYAYETCANVFYATGQISLSNSVIDAGYKEMMARADRISLSDWRESFLSMIPEHKRMHDRWQLLNNQNIFKRGG